MEPKLYGVEYLEQTARLLQAIKQSSYEPFMPLSNGILLDVGCGTGQDVLNLAQLLPQTVQLKGIDANETMIAKATSDSTNLGNVQFLLGDAALLPFESQSISGLRNERLIQHLHDPVSAFTEFNRVLKPAAPIVVVETDWNSLNLYNCAPGLAKRIQDYYCQKNVANGDAALSLYHWLSTTGFGTIQIKAFPIVTQSLDQVIAFTRLDYVLNKMLEANAITQKELDKLNQSLKIADANSSFTTTLNLIVVSAIKAE